MRQQVRSDKSAETGDTRSWPASPTSGSDAAVKRAPLWLATLFSVILLPALAYAQPPPGAPTGLDDYVGRYELTPTFYLTVTREGRAVYLQATGQPRAQLTPRAGHEFVIVGSSLRVIFGVRRDTGEVVDLLFEQGGLGRRAVKLADSAGPSGPTRVDLPDAVLTRYVGTYEEQPGFAITITRDGDRLLAQLTELAATPIFPESETEFFYEDTDARISFRLDAAGAATALTLRQGGSRVEMTRVEP